MKNESFRAILIISVVVSQMSSEIFSFSSINNAINFQGINGAWGGYIILPTLSVWINYYGNDTFSNSRMMC
ncbi:hypothetical protein KAT36_04330 [Candidatus Pacearchaeota archaeon]|nr:hypothetical protein [Candidatus Pacearchaeota archaeon]